MALADRSQSVPARGRLLVVGAGYMGAQITLQAASSGWAVSVVDPDSAALERVRAKHEQLMRAEERPAPGGQPRRVEYATELEPVAAGVDIAIEAVSERLEIKRKVFAALDRLTPPEALLATNSSAIRIGAIEDVASHPQRLLNMHFFPPVAERPLVELMGGTHTSSDALQRAQSFATSIGMTAVMVRRPSTGFLFNRVWRAIKKECLRVLEQGVGTPEDIDRAWMIIYGTDEGPFGSMDSIGLDVVLDIERIYHAESGLDADRPPQFLIAMVAAGRLGVKSGGGFYTYPEPAFRAPGFINRPMSVSPVRSPAPGESVIGTWRLVSFDHRDADGDLLARLYGEEPRGYLSYTEDGRFHLNVMRTDRARFRGRIPEDGSVEERAAAFSSSLSYAGTWDITAADEAPVMTHRVEISSFPNWSGAELRRTLRVSARELVLTATGGLPAGQKVVVTWERQDGGIG